MARSRRWCAAVLVCVACVACSSSKPTARRDASTSQPPTTTTVPRPTGPAIIIDTDFSRWWDDATAIGLANVLQEQGRANVLGIVTDIPNHIAVGAIDAINTAYGHPDIPLGALAHSDADTAKHGYTDALVAKLPHDVNDSGDVPEAVGLYRTLLQREPDHSVTIVSLGGYTNLAGLIASPAGRTLVTDKVKRLVIMDGLLPGGVGPVTNQKIDLAAATAVVTGSSRSGPWPTPIAWVDGLGGVGTRVGGSLCTKVRADHPMRIVYEDLFGCGEVRDGNWDAPTLLFAVGDVPRVFSVLGQGGAAVINDQGGLSWRTPSTRRDDYYVHPVDQKALNARIEQLLVNDATSER